MLKKLLLISYIFFVLFSIETYGFGINPKKSRGFENLDTSCYYYGEINNKEYFLKFINTDKHSAKGYFFEAGNNLYANKTEFEVKKRGNNFKIKHNGNIYKLKSKLLFTSDSIIGKYAKKRNFLLNFNRYKWSEDINIYKYIKPEFKIFPDIYKTKVFDDITIKYNIIYGDASGYWDSYPSEKESYINILQKGIISSIIKKNLILKMDIYMPEGDTSRNRPFIMFIHGGGFYIGDKQDKPMVEWCKYFASLGYVTASINYRLGFKPTGASLERAGYRAVQDAHAAMRYIVDNNDYFKIDTGRIFTAGTSAGAITSLNLAFMRNENKPKSCYGNLIREDLGNIDGSTNECKSKFKIKAVANMWGAVNDLDILMNSNTSIISFHADGDKIVPFEHDYPFRDIKGNITSYLLNKVYGSSTIHNKAKETGCREKLNKYNGNYHSLHVDEYNNLNSNFYTITKDIQDFFYEEMVPEPCEIVSIPKIPYNTAMIKYETNNTSFQEIYWNIEGGIIINSNGNKVETIWFKDAPIHKLMISGYYPNGATFYDEYEF